MNQTKRFQRSTRMLYFLCSLLVATMLLLQNCSKDDPDPVNEEEVVTTLIVTLTPASGTGTTVELKYLDPDGDSGSAQPQVTASGPLAANTPYTGIITLKNETKNPAEDITEEIEEEANDHLFCFTVSLADLEVQPQDEDENGLPIGLRSIWNCETPSTGKVKVALRHQPGTKTGECPGSGDTDIEVEFDVEIK
jgi:hypothetical protein